MKEDILEILITEQQLKDKVAQLGKIISKDYRSKEPVLIGVLKGAVIFVSDLIRNMDIPLTIDFMAISSYGMSTHSSGVVKILKDLDKSIQDKDVIIIEDIIDSGLTLSYLKRNLMEKGPKSIRICALLDKPERRKTDVKVDYIGFEIPDKFVVGYGLDYAGKYRNLPFIGVLKPEVYSE